MPKISQKWEEVRINILLGKSDKGKGDHGKDYGKGKDPQSDGRAHELPGPSSGKGFGKGPFDSQVPPEVMDMEIAISFLIPSTAVSSVIGRGGQNLKQLKKEYDAQIQVSSESEPDTNENNVTWAANKRFEISKFKFKFPRARTYELIRARSRLYRSQILQVNTRWN